MIKYIIIYNKKEIPPTPLKGGVAATPLYFIIL